MIRGVLHLSHKKLSFSDELDQVRAPEEGVVWIDIEKPARSELDVLAERFGFHPLALEDCEHLDQLPKIEEYEGHLFVVVHGFTCAGEPSQLELHELHAFLSRKFLITVHHDPIAGLERLWQRARLDPTPMRRGLDFLLYDICDQMVDDNFPILDAISEEIEKIEDAMLPAAVGSTPRRRRIYQDTAKFLQKIMSIKHALVMMRKVLSPQREVFNRLAYRGEPYVDPKTGFYYRNIYDHLVRLYEQIDTDRDLLGNALDAHFSVVSQRTNETVVRLTLVSIVFLPLTFVTGFFGMNFEGLPFRDDRLMWATVGVVALVPCLLLLWFYQKRWFR